VDERLAKESDMNQYNSSASGMLKSRRLKREEVLLTDMYGEIIKNLEYSKMTLLNNTPIITLIDKPKLPLQVDGKSKTFLGSLGALLGGFLSVVFFVLKKLFKDALAVRL
jgi:uncharacterized protein involved in exopolysaccharide biosynthesis